MTYKIEAEMDFEPIYITDGDTDFPIVKVYRFGKPEEELAFARSIRDLLLPKGNIQALAQRLESGAADDIWYDSTNFGDNDDLPDRIEDAQTAMTEAAALLVSLKAILTQAEARIVGLFNDIAPSSEGRFADKDPVVQAIREVLK